MSNEVEGKKTKTSSNTKVIDIIGNFFNCLIFILKFSFIAIVCILVLSMFMPDNFIRVFEFFKR